MPFGLYASNNALGVYDTLPSFALRFPYDMIVLHVILLSLQALNLVIIFKKGTRAEKILDSLRSRGAAKISIVEYILLSVMAIPSFVLFASGLTATFTSLGNAVYDLKFLYLLLLVGIIPMGNLVFLAIKPEKLMKTKAKKLLTLGIALAVNLIFGALFFIFEAVHPDYIVHLGKPFFLIAFSVSMPIEPLIILLIMAISVVTLAVRFVMNLRAPEGENHVE